MKKRIKQLLFVVTLVSGLGFIGHSAFAVHVPAIDRDEYVTYFRGQFFTGYGGGSNAGSVFPPPAYISVNNVNQFVQTTHDYLYNPTPQGVHDNNDQIGSAAYVVDSMLGKKGPDFGGNWNTGVQYAKDHWAEWESTVRYYDSQGWVNYNDAYSYCAPFFHYNEDYTLSDVFAYQWSSGGCNTDTAITFSNPSGGYYRLMKDCGNPNGEQEPLNPPAAPPTGKINPPTPADGSTTPPSPPGYKNGNPNLYSTCQLITGFAHDPADPAYATKVRLSYSTGDTAIAIASTSSPYYFSSATPAAVKNNLSAVTVTAVGIRADGVTTFALTGSPISIGPCLLPTPSCGAMTVTPSSIDPGTPFTVTTTVRYASLLEAQLVQSQPGFHYFITITGPSGYNFSSNVAPSGPDPSTFTFTGSVARPATGISGEYAVGWGIGGPTGAINCGAAIPGNPTPPTFPVLNLPYFQVQGGDISAGAGMSVGGVDCAVTANNNASIVSWNRGSSGGYGGAGTKYGALALNHLQDFATGQGSGTEPIGFSFANNNAPSGTVDTAGGQFGGKFNASPCQSDYFSGATPPTTQVGNITVPGQAVANGTHTTLYINGNAYINGNITFSGNYPNVSDIPRFTLVVKGNIYIAPGVTRLDGFYIAQPTNAAATNGILYSCAPFGFGTTAANVLASTLQANCNQQLTVNGAVAARQVWLLRTFGSVSTPSPAERINYLPEMWMSAPYDSTSSTSLNDYDSITSLPPVL